MTISAKPTGGWPQPSSRMAATVCAAIACRGGIVQHRQGALHRDAVLSVADQRGGEFGLVRGVRQRRDRPARRRAVRAAATAPRPASAVRRAVRSAPPAPSTWRPSRRIRATAACSASPSAQRAVGPCITVAASAPGPGRGLQAGNQVRGLHQADGAPRIVRHDRGACPGAVQQSGDRGHRCSGVDNRGTMLRGGACGQAQPVEERAHLAAA